MSIPTGARGPTDRLRRSRRRRTRLRAGARLHRLSRRLRDAAPGARGARPHAGARSTRHGDATNTGDVLTYSLAQLADDLLHFVDALGLARFDLLGHSMGGMVVQRFTLANPDRVASLLLMDTASAPIGGRMPREMFLKGAEIARTISMDGLHEIIRNNADKNPQRTAPDRRLEQEWGADKYWARVRRGFTSMDVEAFEALGIELGSGKATTPRLAEIACPTTVLVGEMDVPFLEPSRLMHEAIRGSRLAVIPDGGHSPQMEAPGAWLAAIEAQLRWARGA